MARPRPERAIARVLRSDRRPVGLAFVVSDRTLITCAHVVNGGLGRPTRTEAHPPGDHLLLDFPFGGGRRDRPVRTAEVVGWLPRTGDFAGYDVAALHLDEQLPAGVPRLELSGDDADLTGPVQMWGPSRDRPTEGHVYGQLMGAVDKSRFQVDQELRGVFRVAPGFSGGPVWQPATGLVVGMVQAHGADDGATDVYIIGLELLADVCAGLAPDQPATKPAPSPPPAPHHGTQSRPPSGTVLPSPAGAGQGRAPDRPAAADDIQPPDQHRDLLSKVAQVCRLRLPGATVTEVAGADRTAGYLRVAAAQEGIPGRPVGVEQYPIGVCAGSPTHQDVRRFLTDVVARFRTGQDPVGATLICQQPRVGEELRDWARGRGVKLLSFAEYQIGDDLAPFARTQSSDLVMDPVYPASLYVPQRYTELDHAGRPWDGDPPRPDLLTRLRDWLADPDGHLVVVLGPFGHGKTFLLRELARRMHEAGDPALPVLVNLRDLDKAHGLDELVAAQLVRGGARRIDVEMFRYLLREGRIALLFDGFDELALRISYDRATEHLDRIVRAAQGRAKVVLTSRDHYFRTDAEVATAVSSAFGDRLRTVAGRRIVKLADFDEDQVLAFLTRRLADPVAAKRRIDLLERVRNLLGLSRNPRMLDLIARIEEPRLIAARDRTGGITAAVLYSELIDQWLTGERRRLDRPGTARVPELDELRNAVGELALRLWRSTEPSIGAADLGAIADTLTALTPVPAPTPGQSLSQQQEAAHLLASSTLLVRDGEDRFTFVHQSVLEWLVAAHVADRLPGRAQPEPGSGGGDHAPSSPAQAEPGTPEPLRRAMSPLMTDFLCDLAGRQAVLDWAGRTQPRGQEEDATRENALRVLRHLGVERSVPIQLSGVDLRGRDLSDWQLRGADLSRANLTEARLIGADLTGADLSDTTLTRARLDGCRLAGAMLRGADLSGARLLGADLIDADLSGARLDRAALLGATISPRTLAAAGSAWGAVLPDAALPAVQFRSTTAALRSLAVAASGELMAAAATDGFIRLWDSDNGRQLRELAGDGASACSVAISLDGEWLAAASERGTVRVWNLTTGRLEREWTAGGRPVLSVAFSPDGQSLVSAGIDGSIQIWETTTGRLRRRLTLHAGEISCVAFSADGQRLASAGRDGQIRLWDMPTDRQHKQLIGHTGDVVSLAFSPEGHWLASASTYESVRVWETATGRQRLQLTGHTGGAWSVAFSPDGQHLASVDRHRGILWDLATGSRQGKLIEHPGAGRSIAFLPGGRRLASAGDDGLARVWDPATGQQHCESVGVRPTARSVAFSPHSPLLASTGAGGVIQLWDVASCHRRQELTGHARDVHSVAFSRDGRRLAGAADGTILLWRVRDGSVARTMTGHAGQVSCVAFSPDDQYLASAGHDGAVRLWAVGDSPEPEYYELIGHHAGVLAVAYSPNGQHLASASRDGTIRVWDPVIGKRLYTLTGPTGGVTAVSYSPDGQHLAAAGWDGVIRIWSYPGNLLFQTLTGHFAAVTSVSYSPDGQQLTSAGKDGTIRIWNPETGQQLGALTGHAGHVTSVAYSPDGRYIAGASNAGTVRVWPAGGTGPGVTLVPLDSGGWAALADDLRYKIHGAPSGEFWYVINACRFEPGELDPYVPGLREIGLDEPMLGAAC